MSIALNLKQVRDRINAAAKRAKRDPSAVTLVTVTKTVDIARIREAVVAGALVLGENRVQEAREKIAELGPLASWHLIGRLQSNKAKYAVKLFDLVHSVDSLELARELDRQAAKIGKVQDILIEVSIAGEEQKGGVAPEGLAGFLREAAALGNIRVKGFMAMPPYSDDAEASRPWFRKLRALAEAVRAAAIPGVSTDMLSMGMSGDFEVAVEEGATLVRVGMAIFGERK